MMNKVSKFKIIIILSFLPYMFFLNACAQNNHREKAYQDMKDFVLNEDYSGVGYLLFFETDNKNQITYQSAFDLQRDLYYSPKFKDVEKESFFKKIMLGEIILSCKDLISCFNLSPKIIEDYRKKGFDEFLKTNTKYIEKDKEYIITHTLNHDEKLSVAYYLYKNNYYTTFDDYSGDFFSQKDPIYEEAETDLENLEEIKE